MTCRKLLIDRFLALYGPPQSDNPAMFFAEWQKLYDGVDAEILTRTVDKLIKRREYPTWPTIGEFHALFEDVRASVEAFRAAARPRLEAPRPSAQTEKHRAQMRERFARLRQDVIGRALVREGKYRPEART